MIRKQVYIESRQETTLKRQARALGITEAEVIRRAIDRQMTSVRLSIRDLKAWKRERAFITKRMAKVMPLEAGSGNGKMPMKKG